MDATSRLGFREGSLSAFDDGDCKSLFGDDREG